MILTLEGATYSELKAKVAELYKEMHGTSVSQIAKQTLEIHEDEKPKKKKKEEPAPVKAPPTNNVNDLFAAPVVSSATKDDVLSAVEKLCKSAGGVEKCTQIFNSVGAMKLSDIDPKNYSVVIEKITQATPSNA